ncbi:hypothetical protein Tdes44962_MAKER08172 [Teratosphaeria destructans]|uniref:Uncharacterized protein n=1 Tax=Teratosphaeria destructans TaxID=418781 RepID=A0A9W7SWV9_9PEZI|nr:hypothetical protein Tdes44962_MAKER08172 [Teratosphaeria destructans]
MADTCDTTSLRRIPGPPDATTFTELYASTGGRLYFGGMINASLPPGGAYHPGDSSPLEYYLAHPDEPFSALSGQLLGRHEARTGCPGCVHAGFARQLICRSPRAFDAGWGGDCRRAQGC